MTAQDDAARTDAAAADVPHDPKGADGGADGGAGGGIAPLVASGGVIESAMDTGQGADDEPEMTIGDRYDGGDDEEELSRDEAARELGASRR